LKKLDDSWLGLSQTVKYYDRCVEILRVRILVAAKHIQIFPPETSRNSSWVVKGEAFSREVRDQRRKRKRFFPRGRI